MNAGGRELTTSRDAGWADPAAEPFEGERWEFRIGASVFAADGLLGTLRRVVMDPGGQWVSGIIVRSGTLLHRDLLIPLSAVERASDEAVYLTWTAEEARERGHFGDSLFHVPALTLGQYARGEAVTSLRGGPPGLPQEAGEPPRGLPLIRAGLRVEALDGSAGRVREVLVASPSGKVTHLVLHHVLLWAWDRLMPVEWVREVTEELVAVEATLADLARLPVYRSDEELAVAILDEWIRDEVIRTCLQASPRLRPRVHDGIVILQGYVWSRMQKRRIEELTYTVPGVLDVCNELVADDDLITEVTAALAADPRTRDLRVRVSSYLGAVRLHGEAPTFAAADLAGRLAAAVPHVRSVVNLLRVRGEEKHPPLRGRRIAPRVGQRVVSAGREVGQVLHVVLSPRSRLVTAIVVGLAVPDPETVDTTGLPPDLPLQDRSVVIPAEWVETVSVEEVKLRVSLKEAVLAPEYRPEEFVVPDPGWEVPPPFELREVLVELHLPDLPLADYEAVPGAPLAVPSAICPVEPDPETGSLKPDCSWPVVGRGDPVKAREGEIGVVDHTLVDPRTGLAAYLVIRAGRGLRKDTLVPVDWIRSLDADGLCVDAGPFMLHTLPEHCPPFTDEELRLEIQQEINDRIGPPQPGTPYGVVVEVTSGEVKLSGRVRSEAERGLAIRIAREKPGVWAVEDRLITDAYLVARMSAGLAGHPWTRGADLTPEVREGELILHGSAPAEAHAAAAAIGAEVKAGLGSDPARGTAGEDPGD